MAAPNPAKAERVVRLLLDDYCCMVNAVTFSATRQTRARYHHFEPLCEADIVRLFTKFPPDAASFLQRLQLRPTHGLREEGLDVVKFDAADPIWADGCIVRSTRTMQPGKEYSFERLKHTNREPRNDGESTTTVVGKEVVKGLLWEAFIEKRCYSKKPSKHQRAKTTTALVPIAARIAASTLHSEHYQRRKLPFSRLLECSCNYANAYDAADIFEAPVLKAIIAHKWSVSCRAIFMTRFVTYVIYLTSLTAFIVIDTEHDLDSCYQSSWLCAVAVGMWYTCMCFTIMQWKTELQNLLDVGWQGYADRFVQRTFGIVGLLLASVALIAARVKHEHWSGQTTRKNINAAAVFSQWLNLAFFLRGYDKTAPLIKMLANIVVRMKYFVLVLMIINAGFSFVFYILLRDNGTDMARFGGIRETALTSYSMIYGDFDVTWFLDADTGGMAALMFALFMFIQTVVMLNALIAIMSESYAESKKQEEANRWMMRAHLILESEGLITQNSKQEFQTASMFTDISWWMWLWRVLQVALSLKIRSDEQVTSKYLHVLSLESPPSGVEQEYHLRGTSCCDRSLGLTEKSGMRVLRIRSRSR
jgi:hypothetical protein